MFLPVNCEVFIDKPRGTYTTTCPYQLMLLTWFMRIELFIRIVLYHVPASEDSEMLEHQQDEENRMILLKNQSPQLDPCTFHTE